jgi:hypothetical protein
MRIALVVLLVAASRAGAAGANHYVELVNTAPDSISSFAIAAAVSNDFHDVPLGQSPIQGGGDSTTIAIGGEGCLRDFRTVFGNGRTLIQKDFNVCRYRSYHTGQYLRRHEPEATLAKS